MAYNVFCTACGRSRNLAELVRGNTGAVCPCRQEHTLDWWARITRMQVKIPPNPLPANMYVAWGVKTKQNRDTGILRTMMEASGGMRPGKSAKPGLEQKNALTGIRPDAPEHKDLPTGGGDVRIYIAKDDVELRGKFYVSTRANGCASGLTMLLLNGSGASIGKHMEEVILRYQGWGADVLAVDYRGIGTSTGRATSHGLYTDAEAMLAYLTDSPDMGGRGIPALKVVIHGFSFGSGPACELAVHHAQPLDGMVAGLVLHCPFKSFGSAAAFATPLGKKIVGKVASWGVGYNNIRKLLHMGDLPIHVVYADADENVNPQDAKDLAAVQRVPAITIQEYSGGHLKCDEIFYGSRGGNTTGTLREFVTGLPRPA